MSSLALKGEAREVALAKRRRCCRWRRTTRCVQRLAELVSDVDDGEVGEGSTELLESVLELGLQTGRVRAYYGPGGEQAAVSTLRRLPKGRERSESAREVTAALRALNGQQIDAVKIAAVSPGAFTITIEAGGVEASVRLDHTAPDSTSLVRRDGHPSLHGVPRSAGQGLPRCRRRPCRDGEGARTARLRGEGDRGRAAGRRRSSSSAGPPRAA